MRGGACGRPRRDWSCTFPLQNSTMQKGAATRDADLGEAHDDFLHYAAACSTDKCRGCRGSRAARIAFDLRALRMDPGTSALVSAIAAVVAALGTLVTVWSFRREQLNQKIGAAKWKMEYFADLLKWSDEAMYVLSEAMHLCELAPTRMGEGKFFEQRHLLRLKLSALIDRGRWFFPNYAIEAYGQHKPEAFRGYRHAALDGLVTAYRELCSLDYQSGKNNSDRRDGIEMAKRTFTGEIQKVLDPRSRDDEFRKLVKDVAAT
jgi:hypothetical protein